MQKKPPVSPAAPVSPRKEAGARVPSPPGGGGSAEVSSDLGGHALDGAVRAMFGLTWGRARDLIRRGKVAVDARTVTDPLVRVRKGSVITLDLAARKTIRGDAILPAEAFVFVDPHVVVVDKPSGVPTIPFDPSGMAKSIATRPAKPSEEVTLDELVRAWLARRERARGRGGPPPDLGVVHRLDKETSGLVVFTRTWAAKKALMQAFRVHAVHRRYFAIVHGEAKSETIRSHFVPDRGDGLRGSVEKRRGRKHVIGNEQTQLAITHVEAIEALPGKAAGQPCTLVSCRLETGRTHQIRIHLAESGHPVVGERVYVRDYDAPLVPAPRVMLHAAELGFAHPATHEEMRWTSPLPADVEEMLAFLRR